VRQNSPLLSKTGLVISMDLGSSFGRKIRSRFDNWVIVGKPTSGTDEQDLISRSVELPRPNGQSQSKIRWLRKTLC
jgi:hypothetical protein